MNFFLKDQNSCQMVNTALVWIRDDFRIQNNDALTYATNQHDIVTAVFILSLIHI